MQSMSDTLQESNLKVLTLGEGVGDGDTVSCCTSWNDGGRGWVD